jgi:hypothetical protein
MNMIMKTAEKKPELIQLPFRCAPDLHVRIIKSLGNCMSHSGKKISKNDFVTRLIELGLKEIDQVVKAST